MLPWRAPLLMPSVQVLPKSTPRSVQTHPRMTIGVHHRSALIISHLMSAQRGWARLGEQFRARVRTQLRTFFDPGKSPKNPPHQRVHENSKKTLKNLHQAHENPRSAPQSAQNCVPGTHAPQLNAVWEENLEDQKFTLHHQELECRRSAS